MKKIVPTPNEYHFPRNAVKSVDCRERDLVIRIADWMDDKDEPSFDVEVYIGGVYDWNESKTFTMYEHKNKDVCKKLAIAFAQAQTAKLL